MILLSVLRNSHWVCPLRNYLFLEFLCHRCHWISSDYFWKFSACLGLITTDNKENSPPLGCPKFLLWNSHSSILEGKTIFFFFTHLPFINVEACRGSCCLFFCFFLRLHLWHMTVPGQIGAATAVCTTAMATLDLSCIYNLNFSLQQHWILNPLSEARDQACILMDSVLAS